MDRISSLPDEIICHIVSFLSAKDAAFATILSKRWQNLFAIIPILQFKDWLKIQGSLMDFLDGVLALPSSSRIGKFSLNCVKLLDYSAYYAQLHHCLCDVMKRGVINLKLKINVKDDYSLPFEVFSCKTVVELKLGTGLVIDVLPENAFLPALEILFLDSVQFKDLRGCAFQTLLSACPVLKELVIDSVDWEHWKWSGIVSSPTLQRLTIKRSEYDGFNGSDLGSITFDTPSLVFLEYSDFVPDEYPTVNLDSLVEATLFLTLTVGHFWVVRILDEDDPLTSDPTNLIQGLRNVEILNLVYSETMQTFSLFREAIPVFKNLVHLSLEIDDEGYCWRFLPVLLKKAPNLKRLVIKGPLHSLGKFEEEEPDDVCECLSGYSFLLSCPMEVLEISLYQKTIDELEHVKHFLGKLSCLELLKVRVFSRGYDKADLKITTDLLMLPKASPKCKIKIEFF